MAFENILKALVAKEKILPYLENQIMSEKWPDSYTITIDSSPYYGHGDGYFHPSTHPLMGERELYLRFHPDTRDKVLRERPTMKREMTLAMGTSLGSVVQTQFMQTGLVTAADCEVEYVLHEQHVRGRIDFIVHLPTGEDVVVEMKTQNPYAFKKQEEVKPSWDAQLSLAEFSQDKTSGVLLVVESGWPYTMKEYPHQRNDNLLDEVFDKFARVRKAIAENKPPGFCCRYESPEMTACQARFECWLKEEN